MRSIVVNELHVTNWDRYKDYQEQVPATLAQFDGQYVSRGEPEPILGNAPSPRVVVLEFSESGTSVGLVSLIGIPAHPGDP
jgi:uncharacterized protein (DUF1330 family)